MSLFLFLFSCDPLKGRVEGEKRRETQPLIPTERLIRQGICIV